MNKSVIGLISLIVVALVAGGAYVLAKNDSGSSTANQTQSTPPPSPTSPGVSDNTSEGAQSISKDEVSKHSTADDCWTIIDSKVYDITSYVPRHPGGDEILRACGNDSTTLFNTRTTDTGEKVGSGTPHSDSAKSQLQDFYKGELAL